MRKIEFIAPVNAMRGRMSERQPLQYAEKNNPAFDAPNGTNYARNYSTQYVGAKRSADGKKFFQVRSRSAAVINSSTKLTMALLGGTGAIYGALLKMAKSDATLKAAMLHVKLYYKVSWGTGYTERKIFGRFIKEMLQTKAANVVISYSYTDAGGTEHDETLTIQNPWVVTDSSVDYFPVITPYTLAKFWEQLATNPVVVLISGQKCVCHEGDTFGDIVATPSTEVYNVLGLRLQTYSGFEGKVVMKNTLFVNQLIEEGQATQLEDSPITAGNIYVFAQTAVEPG